MDLDNLTDDERLIAEQAVAMAQAVKLDVGWVNFGCQRPTNHGIRRR